LKELNKIYENNYKEIETKSKQYVYVKKELNVVHEADSLFAMRHSSKIHYRH